MTSERAAANDPAVEAVASDVWRLMAEFTWSRMQRGQAFHALKSLGLTRRATCGCCRPCEPDEAISMGAIADVLQCDPSMATWPDRSTRRAQAA